MFRTPTIIAGAVTASVLAVGITPAAAGAQSDDPVDDVLVAELPSTEVEPPRSGLIVFGADARIDGQRVPDELYLALGYNETFPFLASVWLLVDEATDEWVPICLGYLIGDEDRAVFVGGSTIGDEDDGCLIVPLGDEDDDAGVAFGAIELEGDSVATAAMYAIGG
ncbi:MAG: hypothetical protein HKN41_13240 [Ilumatobacter sp.]|nr:hypothetical protein [Ilumatobacter sp.]